jgi:hypothetical protein
MQQICSNHNAGDKNFGRLEVQIFGHVLSALYGCETWSIILKEERRLRVFENRVSRKTCGHKRDEVTVEKTS